jgi:hypothetical protein
VVTVDVVPGAVETLVVVVVVGDTFVTVDVEVTVVV